MDGGRGLWKDGGMAKVAQRNVPVWALAVAGMAGMWAVARKEEAR